MRRSFWRTVGFVFAGAVVGTLAGRLLAAQIPMLRQSTSVNWHPSADLGVLKYSLSFTLTVNWITLVGAVAAYFLDRRWK
jgi:hypothetical protein